MSALYKGLIASAIISLIGFYPVTTYIFGSPQYFYTAVVGVAVTLAIVYITDY